MLQRESDRCENQARTALAQAREDLALAALQQKAGSPGPVERPAGAVRVAPEGPQGRCRLRHGREAGGAADDGSGGVLGRAGAARRRGPRDRETRPRPGIAGRKNAVEAELGELRDQYQSLRQQADRLAAASQRLQAKITDSGLRQKEAGERSGDPGLTSYEAWYVALAEFLGAKLATLDTRVALVPGPRCGFCLPPPPPA